MTIDAAGWRRLEGLVDEVLELAPEKRDGYLERLRAHDTERARDLEAFLASAAQVADFLEEPVDPGARGLLAGLGGRMLLDEARVPMGRVGPYRLLGELGQGGMGAVYLAERADGQFEQKVALKLVKHGLDSAEILSRFRTERQILAALQHDHIARLLDGGASDGGQPYFAMEYVEGTAITTYCDQARLGLPERLRLFLQVCHAVDYAHRNLVVHRDLKPANVLVTRDGVVKLLDFGIAKVLDARSTEATTHYDARAMTPSYAAPEQLLGQRVTTATDVYALGVVLYELLSGRLPPRWTRPGRDEVEAVMQQREREPPSAAVRREEGAGPTPPEAAAARGLSPEKLVRHLRGDLDRVTAMALRREPERRYPSARALADDIGRFLEGRPVAARPDGFTYRAGKFVKRHRLAVAAAGLLAASVVAGVAGTVWQAREAVRQARKAEQVKRFVFSIFSQADPNAGKGKEITARQLLEEGARRIPELSGQPDVEAEMLVFVGTVDYRLGLARESRPLFDRALALRRELFAEDSVEVAEVELWLGTIALWQGELPDARRLLGNALAKRAQGLGEHHPDTAYARGLLGRVHLEQGDIAGSEALLRAAVDDERRHFGAPHVELASNINFLGRVLMAKGDYDGAEASFREGLEMRRQLFGDEHTRVSESQLNLAGLMQARGDVRGAEPWYRRVLEMDRRILGDNHDKIAIDLHNLGWGLMVTGDYAEAEERLREALEIRRRLHKDDHPMTAQARHALARALRYRGKLAEAEGQSRQALALAAAMLGDGHANVAAVRHGLAEILSARGQLAEAEALSRRALDDQRRGLPAGHPSIADGLVTLSRVLLAGGRAAEAAAFLEDAVGQRRQRLGENDWRTGEARLLLGRCLERLGRGAAATEHLAAARQVLEDRLGAGHPLARQAAARAGVSAGP